MPPWRSRLATLNAAGTADRGIAPHKPLMLLLVTGLIDSTRHPQRLGPLRLSGEFEIASRPGSSKVDEHDPDHEHSR
jgi:hypothetical protein